MHSAPANQAACVTVPTRGVKAKEVFKPVFSFTNSLPGIPAMSSISSPSTVPKDLPFSSDSADFFKAWLFNELNVTEHSREILDVSYPPIVERIFLETSDFLGEYVQFHDASKRAQFIVLRQDESHVSFIICRDKEECEFAFAVNPSDRNPQMNPKDNLWIGFMLTKDSPGNWYLGSRLIRPGNMYGPIFPHFVFPHLTGNRQLFDDKFGRRWKAVRFSLDKTRIGVFGECHYLGHNRCGLTDSMKFVLGNTIAGRAGRNDGHAWMEVLVQEHNSVIAKVFFISAWLLLDGRIGPLPQKYPEHISLPFPPTATFLDLFPV